MTLQIRQAVPADIESLWHHDRRHCAESGHDGDVIFSPTGSMDTPLERYRKDAEESWSKLPTETGWERCWIVEDEFGIGGALRLLNHLRLPSTLHRAILMMGLERRMRGQGAGKRLLETALAWAQTVPSLDWIQLYVFAENRPAMNLYEKFGFRRVGHVADMFRIHGESIDDVEMVLKL